MRWSVEPAEWSWLLSSAAGLLFALRTLRDAWRLRHVVNGGRELIVRADIRRAVCIALVLIIFVVIILPGLFVERAIPLTPQTLGFLVVPWILLFMLATDRRDMQRLVSPALRRGQGT